LQICRLPRWRRAGSRFTVLASFGLLAAAAAAAAVDSSTGRHHERLSIVRSSINGAVLSRPPGVVVAAAASCNAGRHARRSDLGSGDAIRLGKCMWGGGGRPRIDFVLLRPKAGRCTDSHRRVPAARRGRRKSRWSTRKASVK
jgi:hypothetical protein